MYTKGIPTHGRGFSLIELLLVLAIVAALVVSAFIVYPKVQAGRAAEQEAKIITAAAAGIRGLYSSRNYSTVNAQVAANAGVFPAEMVMPDGTIQNRWGEEVDVTPSSTLGANSGIGSKRNHFRIIYRNVPSAVCQKLVGMVEPYFGVIRISSVNGATGDGTLIKNTYNSDRYLEFSPDEAAYKCKHAGAYEGNPTDGIAIILATE